MRCKFCLMVLLLSVGAMSAVAQTSVEPILQPKHNPFRWPEAAIGPVGVSVNASALELPTVRAVIVAGSYRAANINGELLQAGAVVNAYEIAIINEHGVVFRKAGIDYTVPVYRGDEK